MFNLNEEYKESVEKIMESEKAPQIDNDYRKAVTAKMVENQLQFMNESADQANMISTGNVATYDSVLINMVRQAGPQFMAYDITGVQPMSSPSSMIFAMRSRYTSQTGTEALFNEADTAFSGAGTHAGDTSGFATDQFGAGDPVTGTDTGTGMTTGALEKLGTTSGGAFAEMAFSIEKTTVEAKGRALKAEYSTELQHDLKKVHGLDAQAELGKILSTEIVAEIDREVLRTVNISAVVGASNTTAAGIFDVAADADGRWLVERWKGLVFQLEIEANKIALTTRRGKGNIVICSANVASALSMVGLLDYNPQFASSLNVDPSSNTFAGLLNGRLKVYIDPYAAIDYITVAYRGSNAWDAGVYYCPYVPLEMVKATGEDSFQPKIGFKTRFGIVANPFSANTASGAKAGKGLGNGENPYYRKFAVRNLI